MAHAARHFDVRAATPKCSIEVDPRRVDAGTHRVAGASSASTASPRRAGFRSRGAAGGEPHPERGGNARVIDAARANGFRSVNVDLIYGLPRQTLDGFSATLDKVIAAAPDRIALYSYAHLPHLFKPQRRIERSRAAVGRDEARRSWRSRSSRLTPRGYVYIGMDHFAKPDDELAVAQRAGPAAPQLPGLFDARRLRHARLRRLGDRQGRRRPTTRTCETLDEYYDRLDAGALPVLARHRARRRRPGAPRRDPGADVPVRAVDSSRSSSRTGIAFGDYFARGARGARAARGRRAGRDRAGLDRQVTPRGPAAGAHGCDGVRPLPARHSSARRATRA